MERQGLMAVFKGTVRGSVVQGLEIPLSLGWGAFSEENEGRKSGTYRRPLETSHSWVKLRVPRDRKLASGPLRP